MKTLFALMFYFLTALLTFAAADEPAFTRTEDVIYARKYGTALTMDVFTPKQGATGRRSLR